MTALDIDRDLRAQALANPDAMFHVVLCCKAAAGIGDDALAAHGFRPESRQVLADEMFIHGDVRGRDLTGRLSDIAGIDVVSSAPDAEIS